MNHPHEPAITAPGAGMSGNTQVVPREQQCDLVRSTGHSVLGEEDPGAALDLAAGALGDNALRDAAGGGQAVRSARGAPSLERRAPGAERASQLQSAIARWESEGGAGSDASPAAARSGDGQTQVQLTNAELVRLQVRVIALENLVTALLAGATDRTSELACAMAAYISPWPGSTQHQLTIDAAAQMVHLVERSSLFRGAPDS